MVIAQLFSFSASWAQLQTLNEHLTSCPDNVFDAPSNDPFGYPGGTFLNIPNLVPTIPGVDELLIREHAYARNVSIPPNTDVYIKGMWVWFGEGTTKVGSADQFTIKVYRVIGPGSFVLVDSKPFTLDDLAQPYYTPYDAGIPNGGYSYPIPNNYIALNVPIHLNTLAGFNSGDKLAFSLEVKTPTSDDTLSFHFTTPDLPGTACQTDWWVLLGNNADAQPLQWMLYNELFGYLGQELLAGNPMFFPELELIPLTNCFTASATTTQSACASATGTVTVTTNNATAPIDYVLSNGQSILGSSETTVTFNNVAAGTYDVTITDQTGATCDTTFSVTVPSANPPTLSATATPATICAGQSSTLSANSNAVGGNFTWAPGNLSGQSVVVSPSGTTTYTVTVVDENQCSATATATVTVNPNPTPTISATGALPDPVTLTANGVPGGATIQWLLDGVVISGENSSTYVATTQGTYTVQVTAQGCQGSGVITLAPANLLTVCKGSCLPLPPADANIPAGSTLVSWAPIQGLQSPNSLNTNACPHRNTSYTLTYTTPGGATQTATFDIVVRPRPAATITPDGPTEFCAGQSVNLVANLSNDPDCPQYTYRWLRNGLLVNVSTPGNNVYNVNQSGVWTVVVDACGCTRTSLPTFVDVITPVVSTTSDRFICAPNGQDTLFAYVSNQYSNVTYSWAPTTGIIGPTNGSSIVVKPTTTTIYTVTVTATSSGGVTCVNNQSTVNVEVATQLPVSQINITGETQQCEGGSIVLSANPFSNAFGYQWTRTHNGETTTVATDVSSITVTQSGVYRVIITANGCNPQSSVDSVVVNFQPLQVNITGNQEFCQGQSTTLTAVPTPSNAGCTCNWFINGSAVSNGGSCQLTTSQSGTVIVFTTCPGCGTASDTLQVNETQLSITSISGNPVFCLGDQTCLTVNTLPDESTLGAGNIFYQWAVWRNVNGVWQYVNIPIQLGSQNKTLCVKQETNPDENGAGRYRIEVSSPGCVTVYDSIDVTVVNQIQAQVTTNTGYFGFCIGDSLTLNANVTPANLTYTYEWRNLPNTTVISNAPSITVSEAGNYEVRVSTTSCSTTATATAQIQAVVKPDNTITAQGPTEFCYGQSVLITGNTVVGPVVYTWYSDYPNTVAIGTNNLKDYDASETGNYVREVNLSGCIVPSNAITVITSVPVDAGDPIAICQGLQAQLAASPGYVSYQWEPANLIVGSSTIRNPIALPMETTTFTVTAVDVDGCVTSDQITVTVQPEIQLTANTGICLGSTVPFQLEATLLSGNPGTYSWAPTVGLNDATIPNPTITSLGQTTVYTVTVSDANGCIGSKTVEIRVVDLDTVSITTNTGGATLCGISATLTLTATSLNGFTYTWYRNGSVVQGPSNQFTYTATQPGTYTYEVTGPGCGTFLQPDVPFVVTQTDVLPTIDAGPDLSFCPGGEAQLNVCAIPGFIKYKWLPTTGLPINGNEVCNPIAKPLVPTSYTLYATATNGCIATDEVLVKPVNLDTVQIVSPTDNICEGTPLVLSTTANAGLVYQWYFNGNPIPGATQWNHPVTQTGCYSVLISGPFCTPTMIQEKCVTVIPAPTADAGPTRAVCPGGVTTLQGVTNCPSCLVQWTPSDYIVATDLTVIQPTVQPATIVGSQGILYTLTVTDPVTGCTASDTARVRVYDIEANGVVINTPNGTTFICDNGTLNLIPSVGDGFQYQWQRLVNGSYVNILGVNGGNNFIYTAIEAGTYRVIVNGNNCPVNATSPAITLTTVPAPTANAGSDKGLCPGGFVTLEGTASDNGSGTLTYSWSPATGLIPPTDGLTVQAQPSVPTIYTFTVTAENGCVDTDEVLANVANLDTLAIVSDTQLACSGNTVTLSANVGNGYVYQWYNATTNTPIPGATNWQLPVTESGQFYLIASGLPGSNCSTVQTQTFTVNVAPSPVADAGPDVAICVGNSVLITPQGGINYTFSPLTGLTFSGVPGATPFTPVAQPTATTTYTVTVTGINGCTDTDEITIKVVNLDTVVVNVTGTVIGTGNLCDGNTVRLEASYGDDFGSFTHVWRRNSITIPGATQYFYETTQAGTYDVTISGPGCLTTTTPPVTITIVPKPDIAITADTVGICLGNNATISGSHVGGQAVVSWAWTPTTSLSDANSPTTTVIAPAQTTTYTLVGTAANGCTDEAIATVYVVNLDTVTIQPNGLLTACQGEGQLLKATSGPYGFSYQWFLNGTPINGATAYYYVAQQSGNYSVQISGSGANNCPVVVVGGANVTINPSPTATVSPAGPIRICEGENITLTATETPGITHQWYLDGAPIAGATNPTLTVNASGNYAVQLTNNFGCSNLSADVNVTVNALPPNEITTSTGSPTFCEGGSVTLKAPAGENLTYKWFRVPGVLVATGPEYTVVQTAQYYLEVTNIITGCINTSDVVLISGAASTLTWDTNATFSTSPSACTADDGALIATVKERFPGETFEFFINGHGPYLTGFNFIEFNKNLDPGNQDFVIKPGYYHIKAVDAAGCEIDTVLTVSDIVDFVVGSLDIVPESCVGSDGQVTITVNGAATGIPYEFSIDNGENWVPAQNTIDNTGASHTFGGLSASSGYPIMVKRGECELALNALLEVPNGCCPTPTAQSVSEIGYTTATLKWLGTNQVYEVQISFAGLNAWTTFQTNNTSYVFNNLLSDVCYDVRVRGVCAQGATFSPYTTIENFCTPVCGTPDPLQITNINFTNSSISWGGGQNANSYEVGISPQGGESWTTIVVGANVFDYNFLNLEIANCYDIRVRAICPDGGASPYLFDVFCTLDCPTLTDQPTVNAGTTSATLTWAPIATAISYEVTYKVLGGTEPPSTITTPTNSIFIEGLLPNTVYEYSIRVICSSEISSQPIIGIFPTNPVIVECLAPADANVIAQTVSTLSVQWSAVSNATSGYRIEWANANTPGTIINSEDVPSVQLSYEVTGLEANTLYVVYVRSLCENAAVSDPISTFGQTEPSIFPCTDPTAPTFSDITTSSVTLAWNAVPGAASYEVRYRKVGDPNFEPNIPVSGTSLDLLALISATPYEVCVRSICVDPNSIPSNWVCANFTTEVITEFCQPPITVAEPFDITANGATIFWTEVEGVSNYELYYRKDTEGAWNGPIPVIGQNFYIFTELEPATNYQIQLRSDCFGGNNPTSDPIFTFFTTAPVSNCPAPQNISFSNQTTTAATVTWEFSDNAIAYQLEYKRFLDTDWIIASSSILGTSFDLSGLEPSTDYQARVRAVCETGTVFSNPTVANFATESSATCITPESFNFTDITESTASFSWDPVALATAYEFRYRPVGNTNWNIQTVSTNSITLLGLASSTTYEVLLRAVCGANDFSPTTANVITTLQGCTTPTGLTVVSTTTTTANVTWNSVPGATAYRVSWRRASSQSWSQLEIGTVTAYQIQNLPAGTAHFVRVRAVCGTQLTDWTSQVPFSTLVPRSDENTIADDADAFKFSVYPNPSRGQFALSFEGMADEDVTVRIFDAAGQLVYVQGYTANDGFNRIELALENEIARGIYMLQLSSQSKGVRSTRIIVQ